MAFGSDIRRSEDEDGKDFMQQIHDSEAYWAEVVRGYRNGWLRPHRQKMTVFYTSWPERHVYN